MKKYGNGGDDAKEKAFQIESMVRRVEPTVSWENLTLPQTKLSQLKIICNQARETLWIFRESGLDRERSHGKGLNVLFSGPPGCDKIMATEVMAADLGIPLYVIDLSSVVSKYIGETEKNLDKIFSEAAKSNAILVFDEADSLFGKRTQVSDSHDRYTNIEAGYLLQRMEEYSGLTILASNRRQNMDETFVRRMHFIVEFPSQRTNGGKPWDMVWRWFIRILRNT